jgi:hypothetical protein
MARRSGIPRKIGRLADGGRWDEGPHLAQHTMQHLPAVIAPGAFPSLPGAIALSESRRLRVAGVTPAREGASAAGRRQGGRSIARDR